MSRTTPKDYSVNLAVNEFESVHDKVDDVVSCGVVHGKGHEGVRSVEPNRSRSVQGSQEDLTSARQKSLKAVDERGDEQQIRTAIAVAVEKEPFTTRMDRRVRYWVDGLVIGSEKFIRETMIRARGQGALKNRRLTRALTDSGQPTPLCSFKQLHVLLE